MKFPFGKHKGEDLHQVPTDYLEYILENFDLKPPLKSAVKGESTNRQHPLRKPQPVCSDTLTVAYRQMSKKYHPDKGGSTEAMQAINEFYQLLKD